jgi:hypothetical protein
MISAFNYPDGATLGKAIFNENEMYCGLRNKREFHALKNSGTYDVSIWVDRSDVLPLEDSSSMTLEQWMTDYTIDNNGTLEELEFNTCQLMDYLLKVKP